MFILSALAPISIGFNVIKQSLSLNTGNILYVGGSGPGNYSKIQDAIDDADYGDTIFVFSGEYFENVIIGKSIALIGEDKQTTIVNGGGTNDKDVIKITKNDVQVTGFSLKNAGDEYWESGILITSNGNIVENNLIYDCLFGIRIDSADYNIISGNEVYSNDHDGVWLNEANENLIENNLIYNNGYDGLDLWHESNKNEIINNTINSNDHDGVWIYDLCNYNTFIDNKIINNLDNGIAMFDSIGNEFESNNIQNNKKIGVRLIDSNDIIFKRNNIYQNRRNIQFILPKIFTKNTWDENYYGFKLLSFHPIIGMKTLYAERIPTGEVIFRIAIPCLGIDWNVATEPYDI